MSSAFRVIGIAALGLAAIILIVALAEASWIVGMGAAIGWLVLIGLAALAMARQRA
jgi:hypothetical protein